MKRFVRNASPDFWREREDAWLESAPRTSGKDAFRNRKYERRTLADWFHELVRPDDHPRNCAYCDGPLGETSPPTIDHFIPEREAPHARALVGEPVPCVQLLQHDLQARSVGCVLDSP